MNFLTSSPITIRPKIGIRRFGKSLGLINQNARESWVWSGSSAGIWGKLAQGMSPQETAGLISGKFSVPLESAHQDVAGFVEQLWERRIIDVPGMEGVSDKERAAMVKEQAHNRNGTMVRIAVENETMFNCIFDLLVPCNLRCRHCYLDFSHKDIMPLEEVCNYLDQLADHGCPTVTFTGGEIFLRKDLMSIIAHAEKKGFLIVLLTNGNFINQKVADELAGFSLESVQISMYGSTAATHELITRKPGTYEQSTNAARLLIERGINVSLAYFVQHDNVEEAFGFGEFATRMGADYKFDTKLVPNRNGSKELLRYAVTLPQMSELLRRKVVGHETNFLCTAALGKARITAHGEVFPCELINTASLGNLRRQTLAEMWDSMRRQKLRQEILGYKPNRCKSCSHTSDCEPCAAMRGFNQPEHMEAPVSEACFITTASLVSQGKNANDTTFFQQGGDSCVSALLNGEGSQQQSTLVQIMSARSGVVSDNAETGRSNHA